MRRRLQSLPVLMILLGYGTLAMFLPALHAAVTGDWEVARAFLHSALLFGLVFIFFAIVFDRPPAIRPARSHLLALLGAFTIGPLMLAVPVTEALPGIRLFDAWFEMVSSLTTTGATLLPSMPTVSPTVHLWRAEVGWLGGFLAWVTAVGVLAPLNLGGFEVSSGTGIGGGGILRGPITHVADPAERLRRFAAQLLPVYSALTLCLWLGLILAGSDPLVALCHAMSTMATSGISPIGGLTESGAGFAGEIVIFPFFVFALSRLTFRADERPQALRSLATDPELRVALALVTSVMVLLFARHWFDPRATQWDGLDAIGALWGAAFTAASFLTTTGFESRSWQIAQSWSALQTPALILMGLALVGGGIATTAGGVKLLRVYALYKHGEREIERLVHPSSIGGAGAEARRIRRQGAYLAWIFFMLFAISVTVVSGAFALTGLDFRAANILTIAALSTTGPLANVTGEVPISYAALSDAAKAVFSAAMIVGRLETLALIALLNPALWRA
ncbi:TrkH family potassium uptake protein [Roseitranquillus sediminis]|uniref:TrkH family potassium uptake protein n=1 Tax=Roseitranquillus sediminis TaxID=2809051 RepID=UPI001D0C542F|nr:potassium transporter TrkG [Roseitranquillus sediminis]MBM9595559.1 TrkH family potassium uptake protein [Roseitranquillus sediminis]